MSLTLTPIGIPHSLGDLKAVIADIAFDSSYPTGGESLTPGDLGLNTIDFLLAEPASGYTFEYDHTNSKLIARLSAAHTHTENTAASYAQNATTAASTAVALAQVANTTDLSAVTGVRVIAYGR